MSFTIDDVLEVLQIVKECDDTELHIATGDLKLSLFKGDVGDSGRSLFESSAAAAAPAAAPALTAEPAALQAKEAPAASKPAPSAAIEPVTDSEVEEGLVPIKANVTSVFYRKPSPEEPAFVEVGDEVEPDTVICLLEVMKCFRQVTADVAGRIEKICAESNHMVEEGTILFLIRPN